MRSTGWFGIVWIGLSACGGRAVPATAPRTGSYPALAAIREDDLRRDIFYLASDAMRGREAGTLDELRASAWLADQARAIGLEPAGDDGTYFQFWSMRRLRTAQASLIKIGDRQLALGTDAIVTLPTNTGVDAPLVFVGEGKAKDVEGKDLAGKAVAALISAPSTPIPARVSIRPARYAFAAVAERAAFLTSRGAAAVILVSDAVADSGWAFASMFLGRGQYGIDSVAPVRGVGTVPIVWIRQSFADLVSRPDQRFTAAMSAESCLYPSVNVVARGPTSLLAGRAGIPALYFTTLLHPRYHTPKDEAAAINIPKLARMTRWMYATAWLVANAASRPLVDEGFKLER